MMASGSKPRLFIHVEEPSMAEAVKFLLAKIPSAARYQVDIIDHGSKSQLMKDLPQRLGGYKGMARSMDLGVVVLVDRDADDCHDLKQRLERMATEKGMATKSAPGHDGLFRVVNRIVIEELEAWFFGDVAALRTAYPRIPETLAHQQKYRNPDAIRGGTWEALYEILKKSNYYERMGKLPKLEVARKVAPFMDPEANRSTSFRVFFEGLLALLALPLTGETD